MIRFNVKNRTAMTVNEKKSIDMSVHPAVIVVAPPDVYEGSYEATPKMEAQTLVTKDKYLRENVQINAIPIIRVSNTSGGTTVFIANEV